MMNRFAVFSFTALLVLSGCVSSPESLENGTKSSFRFEYPEVRSVRVVDTYSDGGQLTRLDLLVAGSPVSCYGKFSGDLVNRIKQTETLHKVTVKKIDGGHLMVESIQLTMGIYGRLQYWLAYSWLSDIFPYQVAHSISLIVPVFAFLLIVGAGFIFVEF